MLPAIAMLAAVVSAGEWTTADGAVAVALPDESRFVQTDIEPPLAVAWVSNDETVKLAVSESPFPANMKLIQSSVEEGLAEEIGGKIVGSSAVQVDGHDVFTMTGYTDKPGFDFYITQSVFVREGKAYKLMALGLGTDIRADVDVAAFLDSLSIQSSAPRDAANASGSRSAPPTGDYSETSPVDLWSRRIGGISALVLLGGAALLLVRYVARRRPAGSAAAPDADGKANTGNG